ncbi:putative Alpha,alpha-trehalose-phosphate synthase [Cardiosporidium cionae]|uniref:Alpha,alpha-trehalose-phosphate synthase n=1 Tax=Cardiosporidium cionae TaxID=476202 RepID=A0ABQ7JAT5_9APIC|nr:putative Alpha,alpha-trehalose-phosphate synthase [Cardiosporidium cionae]|eukprot:KAF8821113.1 putative Alpha,alpha-trehalose-phosphate synthase [Cardiosporidium cionae]
MSQNSRYSNFPASYLDYFSFHGEPMGQHSFLNNELEPLPCRGVENATHSSALDTQAAGKVILVTRKLPFKVSVQADWQEVKRKYSERELGHKALPSNVNITCSLDADIVLCKDKSDEFQSNDESAALQYASKKQNKKPTNLSGDFHPKLEPYENFSRKQTKSPPNFTAGRVEGDAVKVVTTKALPHSACNDFYTPNDFDDCSSDDIWTVVEDDFCVNVGNFIGGSMQQITIGDPIFNFDQLTDDIDEIKFLEDTLSSKLKGKNCIPVFLEEDARKETYSEQLLSPLFHYHTPPLGTGFPELDWSGYVKLNEEFLRVLKTVYKEGDYVLIFDFHLMLLPQLVREIDSVAKVGFYLNSIFPSSEMFRILPQREELLRGVLSANMVGFHSFQYKRHFLTACTRVLGVECSDRGIEPCTETGGTGSRVVSTPCGIDNDRWLREVEIPEFLKRLEDLKSKMGARKIILGIDSLAYVRGIPHKIMAFHEFLANHPTWASKVLFLQIALHKGFSRASQASKTQQLSTDQLNILSQVYEVCGAINAEFGSFDALPVHFLLADLKIEELAPLYACADVAIVTSLRESLSTIAYEFILCQRKSNKGVIILSEFSGSAQSLGAAALCVNPWDIHTFAIAIHDALVMNDHEKSVRHEFAYNYVLKHDVKMWGRRLMSDLQHAVQDLEHERLSIPPYLTKERAMQAFLNGKHCFIILGLRGCLFPQRHRPIEADLFQFENLPLHVRTALKTLSEDKNITIFVVSSASIQTMERAIGNIPNLYLFAENGHFMRQPMSKEFVAELADIDTSWLERVVEAFQYFVQRTPGSFVHKTETAVSWHYENTHRDHGAMQARDLLMHLWAGPMRAKSQADIAVGSESVEVRASNLSKALCIEKYVKEVMGKRSLSPQECMFLCLGNYLPRDEDIFQVLQKVSSGSTTIKSGGTNSSGVAPQIPPHAPASSTEGHVTKNQDNSVKSNRNNGISLPSVWGKLQTSLPFNLYESQSLMTERRKLLGAPRSSQDNIKTEGKNAFLPYYRGAAFGSRSLSVSPSTNAPTRQHLPNVLACTVGRKQSRADYHLSNENDVGLLLDSLAKIVETSKEISDVVTHFNSQLESDSYIAKKSLIDSAVV